jgi:hypothetical protein
MQTAGKISKYVSFLKDKNYGRFVTEAVCLVGAACVAPSLLGHIGVEITRNALLKIAAFNMFVTYLFRGGQLVFGETAQASRTPPTNVILELDTT